MILTSPKQPIRVYLFVVLWLKKLLYKSQLILATLKKLLKKSSKNSLKNNKINAMLIPKNMTDVYVQKTGLANIVIENGKSTAILK